MRIHIYYLFIESRDKAQDLALSSFLFNVIISLVFYITKNLAKQISFFLFILIRTKAPDLVFKRSL